MLRKKGSPFNCLCCFFLFFLLSFWTFFILKNSQTEQLMFMLEFSHSHISSVKLIDVTEWPSATWITHFHSYRMMLNRRNNEIAQFVALNNGQMNKHEYSIMITWLHDLTMKFISIFFFGPGYITFVANLYYTHKTKWKIALISSYSSQCWWYDYLRAQTYFITATECTTFGWVNLIPILAYTQFQHRSLKLCFIRKQIS